VWCVVLWGRFASTTPVSYVDNRCALLEAVDRDGALLRPSDVQLLETEIERAERYMQQAERLRDAARRCGHGLPDYDDRTARRTVSDRAIRGKTLQKKL